MSQSKTRLLELNARLAQNLTDKGVQASSKETTTTLVEKVKSIENGIEIYRTKNGVFYTPIYNSGDFPFFIHQVSSNLLRFADKLIEATFLNWTDVLGGVNGNPVTDSSVQRVFFPKLQNATTYVASNNPNMTDAQFGSVGYGVQSLSKYTCAYCTQNNLTITVFVDATTLAEIPEAVTSTAPWGATNATIIYRNSTTGEVITE